MNILVVDDHKSNRMMVKHFIELEGHNCIEAENGQVAIDKFIEHQPDFVLLDIVMPVIDGFEAAKQIKIHAGDRHVPIIFLTAKHDEKSIIECLESGGDDYLAKPINGVVLNAKIRAHVRTGDLTRQVDSKRIELAEIHASLTQEHKMGRHVLSHTLSRSLQDCSNVRSYISSMSIFNGDLFLLAEDPGGGLYVFLGDFTGHGLSAAIGTIPVAQTFFKMCEKGMNISEIISSMNKSLKAFLPENMFCAATMIHLNEVGRKAYIWSGGLPEAYLVRPGEGVVEEIKSQNMPLGILDDSMFNSKVDVYDLMPRDKILFLTDGILEGTPSNSDEMFGNKRVRSSIAKGDHDFFASLLEDYLRFSEGVGQQDDISLVELIAEPVQMKQRENLTPKSNIPWVTKFVLDVDRIKLQRDPISDIVKMLPQEFYFFRRQDKIRSILTELFSNSLEHGLLGLNSEMKLKGDGFAEYYSHREEGISKLDEGWIIITLDFDVLRTNNELIIKVEDSGSGFDLNKVCTGPLSSNSLPCGRGIALIESFSERVCYSKGGASVEVSFSLSQNGKTGIYPQAVQA